MYADVMQAAARVPELLLAQHKAMSCQLVRDREWRFAPGTLQADARVADFVRDFIRAWAENHWPSV